MHGRQEWLDSHPLPYPVPGGDLRVQLRPLRGHTRTRRPSRPRSQLASSANSSTFAFLAPRSPATPHRGGGVAVPTAPPFWQHAGSESGSGTATQDGGSWRRSFLSLVQQKVSERVEVLRPMQLASGSRGQLHGECGTGSLAQSGSMGENTHAITTLQTTTIATCLEGTRQTTWWRQGQWQGEWQRQGWGIWPFRCPQSRVFAAGAEGSGAPGCSDCSSCEFGAPSGERGQQNSRCPGVALERQGHPPGQLEGAPGYARHTIPSAGEQAPAWPGEGANPCPNRPQQSEGGDGGFRTGLGELLRQASHPSSGTAEAEAGDNREAAEVRGHMGSSACGCLTSPGEGHAEQLGLHAGCFCHGGHGGRRRRGCHQRGHGHSVEGRPRAGHSATHGHVERNSEATASPGRLPNTTSRSRQGRGHGGLQSQPRIKACSYQAAPWRRLNRSQHKGLFRRITTVLAAEAFQQQTWQHSVVMETDYVSPMLAQLIGLSQALEVQLGPWPFLQLIADPRIEPDVDEIDVSAVWDTAYINGSCATSSCAQHEAWIGARGSMDNTATIEPSHASCYGSMTVSAQGSLIGQASTSSIASVHNSESSSCTVDPASRIFAQMDDCLPSVVAGPREWEHVQLPPLRASYPEVLPASPSGLRPCISASGHGIGGASTSPLGSLWPSGFRLLHSFSYPGPHFVPMTMHVPLLLALFLWSRRLHFRLSR